MITDLEPGMHAPNFKAPDQDGKMRSLSDFKGKNVVLYFYPEDDTSGCTKEACHFRDSLERFEELNTVIVGVSTDDEESHQRFREKFNLPFTLISDTDGEIMRAYGVARGNRARRATFVIGPDGEILRVYNKVDPASHAEQLLAELPAQG
jgi:thioredoxin-dependent peroxiredoxin